MKISIALSYAFRATLQLAQLANQGPVPASRLAADGKMPANFLQQILRILVTQGILRSTRGWDGGYSLVRPADQTSLLDIIEAVDGPFDLAIDVRDGLTKDSQAKLRDALRKATKATRRHLESIKLSQLVKPRTRKRPT